VIDIFPIDVPAWQLKSHADAGGKSYAMYQADLGGDEFLSVASGLEPLEGGEYTFHVSVTVKSKKRNQVIHAPSRSQINEVITFFGKDFEIEPHGLVAHLWERKSV
jgi:hypothetical protein